MKETGFDVITIPVGQMAANCYIVWDKESGEAFIVDPGDDAEHIIAEVHKRSLSVKSVAATHGHFDHIMAAAEIHLAFGVPFRLNKKDEFLLEKMNESVRYFLGHNITAVPPRISEELNERSTITIGKQIFTCLHVPGHTPGSMAIIDMHRTIMFSGDTIFADGAVGRSDFSYSDANALHTSLMNILAYPSEMHLYPGHGKNTTVGTELKFHKGIHVS